MGIKYSYNGADLPQLPDQTDLPFALIAKFTGMDFEYGLCLISKPFEVLDGRLIFPHGSEWKAYYYSETYKAWLITSMTTEEDGDWYYFDTNGAYRWSSTNILDHETSEVVYTGSKPVMTVFAETPTITTDLPTAVTCDRDSADPLVIAASVSDGGVLSYQWYRVGDSVDLPLRGEVGTTFTPPTKSLGTHTYYCKVTNTFAEYTAVNETGRVAVEVIHATGRSITDKHYTDPTALYLGWLAGACIRIILIRIKKEEASE